MAAHDEKPPSAEPPAAAGTASAAPEAAASPPATPAATSAETAAPATAASAAVPAAAPAVAPEAAAATPATPAAPAAAAGASAPAAPAAAGLSTKIEAGPGGVMTDEVGVITGELTLQTEVADGKVKLRVQYFEADEWYTVTGGKATLKEPADAEAVHKIAVGLLNRPEG